jgi:hypothetical protein
MMLMRVIVSGCFLALSAFPALSADLRMTTKAPTAVAAVEGWTYSLNTEFQYSSWTSNRGYPTINDPTFGTPASGWQVYVPTSLSMTGLVAPDTKFEFVARSGVVSSGQRTPGQEGQIGTTTDSQLSGTLTYSGIAGIQPYAALLLNLPTGASALYGSSRFARMDPDLVPLSTFGEGFNVGPTIGVNIPINSSLLGGLSAGYTSRGSFNKEGAIDLVTLAQPTDRVKPGDSTTVTGTLGYAEGAVSAQGSVSYSWDTASQTNGIDLYRSGQRLTITGSGSYAWNELWRTSINGFVTQARGNDVPNVVLGLTPEPFNSNATVFRISSDTTYQFSNGVAVGPTAGYLYRDRNSYDPFTFSYSPAKTRIAAGLVGSYGVSSISLNGRVERVWTRELDSPGVGNPIISSEGWFVSLGGTYRF